jgi:hypothetical protein
MNKKILQCVLSLAFLAAVSQSAVAGLILDGKEWEVRGSLGTWSEQETAAASDTGWTWASEADWLATGLNGFQLFDPDWSLLLGALDGSFDFPDAWLSDAPSNRLGRGLYSRTANGTDSAGSFEVINAATGAAAHRMSYRVAAVPAPAPLALLAVPLLMMGWMRRRSA